ncbi:hypothetical protein RCL1_000353 [Eukaryota sp. TZLM3-RCL]
MTSAINNFDTYSPSRQIATLCAWLEDLGLSKTEVLDIILEKLRSIAVDKKFDFERIFLSDEPPNGLDVVLTDPILSAVFREMPGPVGALASELALDTGDVVRFRPNISTAGQLQFVSSVLSSCFSDSFPCSEGRSSEFQQIYQYPPLMPLLFCILNYIQNHSDFNSTVKRKATMLHNLLLKANRTHFPLCSSILYTRDVFSLTSTLFNALSNNHFSQGDILDLVERSRDLIILSPSNRNTVHKIFLELGVVDYLAPLLFNDGYTKSKKRLASLVELLCMCVKPSNFESNKDHLDKAFECFQMTDPQKGLDQLSKQGHVHESPLVAFCTVHYILHVLSKKISLSDSTSTSIFNTVYDIAKYKPLHVKLADILEYYVTDSEWGTYAMNPRAMNEQLVRLLFDRNCVQVILFLSKWQYVLACKPLSGMINAKLRTTPVDEDFAFCLKVVAATRPFLRFEEPKLLQ